MLVTDRTLVPLDALPRAVRAAVEGGVDAVQVRERGLSRVKTIALARSLREAVDRRARLIVNDSCRVAAACGGDGVHLPESAATVMPAERRGLIVGRSAHSLEAARRAEAEGCDYVVLGTVFPSRSHPGGATGGLHLVEQVARSVTIPVIGIGGITPANAGAVVRSGAAGVAVISAILGAPDPGEAARELRDAIDAALAAVEKERA